MKITRAVPDDTPYMNILLTRGEAKALAAVLQNLPHSSTEEFNGDIIRRAVRVALENGVTEEDFNQVSVHLYDSIRNELTQ